MKQTKLFLTACVLLVGMVSCALKKQVTVINTYPSYAGRPTVIHEGQQLPDGAERIGSIIVGEKGMTPTKKCSYNVCMDEIETEAKKIGGDIVYIVRMKEPGVFFGSSCYNITADIYVSAERAAKYK